MTDDGKGPTEEEKAAAAALKEEQARRRAQQLAAAKRRAARKALKLIPRYACNQRERAVIQHRLRARQGLAALADEKLKL